MLGMRNAPTMSATTCPKSESDGNAGNGRVACNNDPHSPKKEERKSSQHDKSEESTKNFSAMDQTHLHGRLRKKWNVKRCRGKRILHLSGTDAVVIRVNARRNHASGAHLSTGMRKLENVGMGANNTAQGGKSQNKTDVPATLRSSRCK
ncbi:hypothetical protein TRVL_01823 [Trypanosoma vivax]|nr:hypothetical protein TRVL_01823 [Trypanosoma vivax]